MTPRWGDPWPWWIDALVGILAVFCLWLIVVEGWPFNGVF